MIDLRTIAAAQRTAKRLRTRYARTMAKLRKATLRRNVERLSLHAMVQDYVAEAAEVLVEELRRK